MLMGATAEIAPIVSQLKSIPTSILSDNLDRLQGAVGMHCVSATPRIAGRAFTVKTRPGDNLFVHLSLDLAMPGDLIVVDAGGDCSNALVGEIMMRYAASREIAGFIVDGAIRDSEAFIEAKFPCFARGTNHRGPYKSGPGQLGVPVSIGGMVVNHGDIVVADADGIVAFPSEIGRDLILKAQATMELEARLLRQIEDGCFDRAWLAPYLDKFGGGLD
jgi:regulator of RNase E activity RraA